MENEKVPFVKAGAILKGGIDCRSTVLQAKQRQVTGGIPPVT